MKYLANIDLNKNELQNARLQNLASAPANPGPGQIYYNSADVKYYGYDGTTWIDLSTILTVSTITSALGFTPKEIAVGLESGKPAASGSLIIYIATDTKKIWYDQGVGNWVQIGGQDTITWSNVTGKPSTFTPPTATTSILGGVKIGSNLSIDANGVLNANDNPTSYIVKQEKFIATEGQKLFNLTKGQYRQGLGALSIFMYGSKIANEAFMETSTTSFTMKNGLSAGDIVLIEYIQLINVQPYPIHANEHLTGGADAIPVVTISKDGLMAAIDKIKLNNSYIKSEVDNLISMAINNLINGAPGALDTILELANAMGNDPNFATSITNALATKVDKVTGKGLSTEDFTTALLNKLNGIATNANNYSHPTTHPPSIITQDISNRFVSDSEKSTWNGKASTSAATTSANGLMSSSDKSKLDGVASGANNYTHPSSHPASIIAQDTSNRFVTDLEKASWNSRTKKYAANVGDGTNTTITVTHSLGTMDITVSLREVASPYNVVMTDIQIVDSNSIKLLFAAAPTSGQYRVVVVG